MSRSRLTAPFALLAALAAGLASGCVSSENAAKTELAAGKRCTLHSDCTSPNVCTFGRCHAECTSSGDCEAGTRCVQSDVAGAGVCQLSDERACATSGDCVGAQVCGVDGACRDLCKGDADCLPGQVCTQATCAETSELDGEGKLPESEAHVGEGQPCQYPSDCPGELFCVGQRCGPECVTTKDCGAERQCVEGRCEPLDVPCTTSSDCGDDARCDEVTGLCVPTCASDAGCSAGDKCLAGTCTAPLYHAPGEGVSALAAAGGLVYFLRGSELVSCDALAGCADGGTLVGVIPPLEAGVVGTPVSSPQLSAHGALVAFTDGLARYGAGIVGTHQAIFTCPIAGPVTGCGAPLVPTFEAQGALHGLAIDGGLSGLSLFASFDTFEDSALAAKFIGWFDAQAPGGSGDGVVAYGVTGPVAVAWGSSLFGDERVFAEDLAGRLVRYDFVTCPASTCAPEVLTHGGGVLDLAVDDDANTLYYVAPSVLGTTLVALDLETKAERVLAHGVVSVAAADGRVYLADTNGIWGLTP